MLALYYKSLWWVAVGTAVIWLCTINHHGGWLWVLALSYKSSWWVAVGVVGGGDSSVVRAPDS